MGTAIRRSINGTWMGESIKMGMLICTQKTNVILIGIRVDDIKMTGKKQILAPIWKKLMKNVDIEEPTSFLEHVHLGCAQRECKPNEIIFEKYKEMFESRISAGAIEKTTRMGKATCENFTVVLRRGRSCSKMRGKVMRIGEYKDRATVQSFKSWFG